MKSLAFVFMKLVGGLLAVFAATGAAFAQSCSVTVTPLTFGNYIGAQIQVTGNVDLLCSGPSGSRANYTVTATPGNSNNYAQRFIQRTVAPGEAINYSLSIMLTNGTSANWGNGTGGTSAWSGRTAPINPGNPTRVATTTYTGTLSAGPVPAAGTYTDTITITATWN